jgi:hypothetical protein
MPTALASAIATPAASPVLADVDLKPARCEESSFVSMFDHMTLTSRSDGIDIDATLVASPSTQVFDVPASPYFAGPIQLFKACVRWRVPRQESNHCSKQLASCIAGYGKISTSRNE